MRIHNARWNGELIVAERGTVMMAATSSAPRFWGRDLLGTRVEVLRISTGNSKPFFIMDEDRQGTEKVLDGGGPWSGRGHRSVPVDDPDTFEPFGEEPKSLCPCRLCMRIREIESRKKGAA
jgi:hypothetical protein